MVVPATLVLVLWGLPYCWSKLEKLNFGEPDFRISYDFRDDYWVYGRWFDYAAGHYDVLFIGDSVVWGMYTDNAHTLSAIYNRKKGWSTAANLGVDGLHPVAMEGLLSDFGGAIRQEKIYLYFNALWLDDPKFDLTALPEHDDAGEVKKFAMMHPRLVPQFDYSLYLYDEPLKQRISNWKERHLPFYSLQNHLRNTFYDNQSLPEWMEKNPCSNPLSSIRREVSVVESTHINRTDAWSARGDGKFEFSWVMLPDSRQWAAFLRTVRLLQRRGNEVTVLQGAFNIHLLDDDSLERYCILMDAAEEQFENLKIQYLRVGELPSEAYGDASHPLASGYERIASQIIEFEEGQQNEH